MEKRKLYLWIGVGVVVALIIVYLGASGVLPFEPAAPGTGRKEDTETAAGGAEALVQGTSGVNEKGEVVTSEGQPVELDAAPGSAAAPQQSDSLTASDVPEGAVKLVMSLGNIIPGRFEVKEGELVMLSVTSGDDIGHILRFDDPQLSAVAVGVGPGETRAITFNAPEKGEYAFYCRVLGHRDRGETGVMIVK